MSDWQSAIVGFCIVFSFILVLWLRGEVQRTIMWRQVAKDYKAKYVRAADEEDRLKRQVENLGFRQATLMDYFDATCRGRRQKCPECKMQVGPGFAGHMLNCFIGPNFDSVLVELGVTSRGEVDSRRRINEDLAAQQRAAWE